MADELPSPPSAGSAPVADPTTEPPSAPPPPDPGGSTLTSPPPPPPPPEDMPPEAESRRPRWVFPVVIVVIAAAVIVGIGVIVAIATDSSDDEYSFDAAMTGLTETEAIAFDLQLSASDVGTVTMSGAATGELLALSLGDDTVDPVVDRESAQVVVDTADGIVYLHIEELLANLGSQAPFDLGLLPDTGWLAVDVESFTDDLIGDDGSLLTDPLAVPELFGEIGADPDELEDLGTEEIDGEETRHYQATVELAERVDEGGTLRDVLSQFGFGELGGGSLGVTYDVWVTEDSELRRLAFELGVAGRQVSMVLDVRALDDDVDIELPPEGDIFELPGLFGD